jgi:Fur family peroxide stress response transcriptional regulator
MILVNGTGDKHTMSEPSSRLQELVSSLRDQGHRMTPQRMAVLAILAESDAHLNVQEIYQQVQADFPMTSLATVYKTITLLKEMGQVLELEFGEHSCRYDGRRPHPHPHLVCVRCSKVMDWDTCQTHDPVEQVAQESGYRMVGYRLDFFGICPRCQQETNRSTL